MNQLEKQEIIDDETALSDRFGLWLGFNKFDTEEYMKVVNSYSKHYNIEIKHLHIQKLNII